ncbi:UDP-N-acetylmuramoyl-L-alanine--D-glutamate ligase [Marmoricola sp. RAF53]|uniref:UDP-N-acetylmuramoyl-L-alanine--D-glutamate ligase n=1 Tax=Marmoricola sp. RAF53 TaxID=3233059 RepID=UPI003F95EECA
MTGALSWADLHGLRVGVWGTGVEGTATLRRLAADGIEPTAVVGGTDDAAVQALLGCDVVVKSPGISPYDAPARTLAQAGVRLVGGLGLWLAGAPKNRVVCITGTKGKSTTTSIAGALVRGLGETCLTGGNLGSPPWDPEAESGPGPADWYVVEVSSYQARDLEVGPAVVVVTSLGEDHLTWHHGVDNYVRDKLSLCTRPGVEVVVVPAGDPGLARHRDLLGEHVVEVGPGSEGAWVDALGLLGAHNRRNALLAREALVRLGVPGADDDAAVARAARDYQPLRSRLTAVGTVGGVDFVDDSLSTNTLPTLAAVDAFAGRRVALLVGGHDRGIDYVPLAEGLAGRADPLLVLTLPDNGPRIAAALAEHAPGVDTRPADDLVAAVGAAYAWARPDGVVLLSPAAPSFGRFKDYAERADVFEAAMRDLED